MNLNQVNFKKITNQFSVKDFEKVKNFILENGKTTTYRNYDNNNPYYDFGRFQVYLSADIGQKNINNDPKLSDFNEMTLKDEDLYYKILIVRKGDILALKTGVLDGMGENEVYYIDSYSIGVDEKSDLLSDYLNIMKRLK
ncbi:hypothetical protein [Flavobacterium johnsoniae]|uniref:Uncharacterized protein n=1 Tax=Flavobacterium johnsoniae TaxID=986 RepID=A0A1J7BMU7_FLAJO|nr:hypothetical protein [Flavobacterium johnsoniae]OIV40027.1 hypothetical protein BKM63_21785 [Flavobacterium johnsoniae]